MSCSKIFSGDLPELTYEVIKNFKNDYSTLHSCILVNRLWCRLAIPLLWENPFSTIPYSYPTRNYKFIKIYLHNLNDDLKAKLNNYKINDNLLPSNPLFNYPSFLKHLNVWSIFYSVEEWFEDILETLYTENEDVSEDLDLVSDFIKLIQMSLFKIFIENVANLDTFEIEIKSTNCNTFYNNILELFLQNPNFFHNIRNLNFYNICPHETIVTAAVTKNRILQIINLHQKLKKILLGNNSIPLYQSLLLSKDYNCSNTLNTFILYRINFKGIIILDKVFEQLNVLESVHIIYCSLNTSFYQQIINLTKPFKLKSLFIDKSHIDNESLLLLLQKSGIYLENFGYEFISLRQELIESIIKYCTNIKFLKTVEIENKIYYQLFNLIENIKQNLYYLSINVLIGGNIECNSSIILQNLGQILPSKLEYLHLSLHIKASDFEVFLKNSQGTIIEKLVIKNINDQDHALPYIKEYIMKRKRVNYLALYEHILVNRYCIRRDLFYLEDEVKEFRLYNIKVQKYSLIDIYNLIKEID
jgi:hypothetical protein